MLTNAQQLAHMLDDLTDVELSGLQAQASLVCSCPDQTVYSALCDIHYNIEHAYTLEQWAQWLHALVNKLVADSGQSLLDFFPSFYLRWSLYGSLLVRHLTVKNAVSFGIILYERFCFKRIIPIFKFFSAHSFTKRFFSFAENFV